MGTDYTLLVALIIGIILGGAVIYFKSRLDTIERKQREQRLPYAVADDTEDIIAVQARITRQLRDVRQTVTDLALFLDAVAKETERTADTARRIRGNGQKGK